jgi:steroid 5-alpha reductase family enzyme
MKSRGREYAEYQRTTNAFFPLVSATVLNPYYS